MNKVHWNSVNPDRAVLDDLFKDLLDFNMDKYGVC